MGAKSGQSKKPGGKQRLALIVFAAVFVLLFAGFAIAQGIGEPSVPAGDVAIVKDVPSEIEAVSEAELEHALLQQASQVKLKKVPQPGEKKYEELMPKALGELLDQIWIGGEAEELGISVTEKQVETELAQIKKQNFKTEKAYQEFLRESHFTQEDVNKRVELQLLSTQIQELIQGAAPRATNSEIQDYYEAEKTTQFTTAASRDIRVIVNESKSEVEKAKAELEKDSSAASWKKVAKKYSSDPSTKAKGGLQPGITEEFVKGELKSAIFDSATSELVGPVKFENNYLLIEVVKLNPKKVKALGEVRSQISSTLTQQKQQEYFSQFVGEYQAKWESRTYCASRFEVEGLQNRCTNLTGSGHPSGASPACYEANPKTPATECPANVPPTSPALPGSVTVLKPKGEPFPQRPRPEPSKTTEATSTEAGAGESSAGGESSSGK